MSGTDMKKTALFEAHKAAGAKMVPFGGWSMPVSYTSVLKEHKTVREACGLFDVSHMGEIFVRGKGAADYLQSLTINDIRRLAVGQSQYSAICLENGGMIDDLFIYRLGETEFLICANASNKEKDFAWMQKHARGKADVQLTDESDAYSQLAIQGPNAREVLFALLDSKDQAVAANMAFADVRKVRVLGTDAILARTGYTGEKGFEIYLPNSAARTCWDACLATNPKTGIEPIGLGARDTLRLEACYVLYGNDMDESVTPLEAGVGWAVRFDAGDFIGRQALADQKEAGVPRKAVGFIMEEDGIPRHDMAIFQGDKQIGKVTSGSVLPTVGGAGGMALLSTEYANLNNTIELDVRGKRKLARIVKKPLYTPRVKD